MGFEPGDLIGQAIERHKGHIAVACSFGKDSIVVLHMALTFDPCIPVIFCNTGVEFPETIRYKNDLKDRWGLNLIETKPIKGFWQCAKEYGLPGIRGRNKGSNVPQCCQYCKEKPAERAYKDHGIMAVITGITAEESRQRRLLIKRYDNKGGEYDGIRLCGQRYYASTSGLWKYHPIAYWSESDVWNYFQEHDIPINEVYTKWGGIYKRCGCLPCTAYSSWEERLPKSHPKLYQKLKRMQTGTPPMF